jgi:hypothetical protein
MAFFHHGTIRKYTAAILDLFNDFEIQYENSLGEAKSRPIPIRYSSREKATVFDEYTTEQLLSGNYSILPRASLTLQSMSKVDSRVTNKNTKINQYKTDSSIDFSFNSVPYEFTFEIIVQCRGMNEATQIIEQIAPKFNPTVNIDVWDAANLNEPTRVPVRLTDIQFSSEDYEELSTNIFTVTFTLSLMGNLYPPIKSQERVKQFKLMMSQVDGKYYQQKELTEWDVDLNGKPIGDTSSTTTDPVPGTVNPGGQPTPTYSLMAAHVGVKDAQGYFDASDVETVLQEIMSKYHQALNNQTTFVGGIKLVTTERLLISNGAISLPFKAAGDIVNNYALIFDDLTTTVVNEFACHISADSWDVQFDASDDLNGKYAVVSYITIT